MRAESTDGMDAASDHTGRGGVFGDGGSSATAATTRLVPLHPDQAIGNSESAAPGRSIRTAHCLKCGSFDCGSRSERVRSFVPG